MTTRLNRFFGATLLLTVACCAFLNYAQASDHADPTLKPPESQAAGITGLFVFPDKDRLIFILNVNRGLTSPAPYDSNDYEYRVHIDLDSKVSFADMENNARYGGTVISPSGIKPTATIIFRINQDAQLLPGYPKYDGSLVNTAQFKTFSGVRDDPFVFPRFFKKNVISMAVSIPFTSFSPDQEDWIIWATTTETSSGDQIDHVGRSNRSQLGRLDFLNTLTPREQAPAARKVFDSGQKIAKWLMRAMSKVKALGAAVGAFEYVLQVREYDIFPDVMFFTRRSRAGFPNGRKLDDDVVALTCAQGDCALQEVAFIEGHWPRITTNDRPFASEFPFLGAAWPEKAPEPTPFDFTGVILFVLGVALLFALIRFQRQRLRKQETPYVRPYRRL